MKSVLIPLVFAGLNVLAAGRAADPQYAMEADKTINVLELRNYLLKPNTTERFQTLFNEQFVGPMNELGGYTLGQYRIDGEKDRFVWMRGFENMPTRLKFLNDFYLTSPAWKTHRAEANSMIVNSDNVHLLRPLTEGISRNLLQNKDDIIVVDFYVCNNSLDKVIDLFRKEYLPFLGILKVSGVTMWVSEMSENDFPRLPVFQDKNLLVTMTKYKDKREFLQKTKQIKNMPEKLNTAILESITVRNQSVLIPFGD
jgi:hypothetical protein